MRYSAEEKAKWLKEWKESGKSAWAYAKEKSLKQQTFAKWVKMERESGCGFVEVSKQALQLPRHVQEILIEKDNTKIHIPLEPFFNELRMIIAGLGQAV